MLQKSPLAGFHGIKCVRKCSWSLGRAAEELTTNPLAIFHSLRGGEVIGRSHACPDHRRGPRARYQPADTRKSKRFSHVLCLVISFNFKWFLVSSSVRKPRLCFFYRAVWVARSFTFKTEAPCQPPRGERLSPGHVWGEKPPFTVHGKINHDLIFLFVPFGTLS